MPIVNLSNYVRCWACNRAMHLPAHADRQLYGNRAFMCQECYERADAPTKGHQTQEVQSECNQQMNGFLGTPVARAKWEMPTKEEAEACHYAYFCHPGDLVDSVRVALEKFVALRNDKL